MWGFLFPSLILIVFQHSAQSLCLKPLACVCLGCLFVSALYSSRTGILELPQPGKSSSVCTSTEPLCSSQRNNQFLIHRPQRLRGKGFRGENGGGGG